MEAGAGPEPTGEKKATEGGTPGTEGAKGKSTEAGGSSRPPSPEGEFMETIRTMQEALKEGAGEAGRILGEARRMIGVAEEHVSAGVAEVGAQLKAMREDFEVIFPSEAAKKALLSSAEVWKLVSSSTLKDGFVTRADGTYASAKFDAFEEKVIHVDSNQTSVAIGVIAGKRYLLTLTNPENPKSSVKMGHDGFDSVEAIPRHLIGRKGSEYFVINPEDGSGSVKIPWRT